MPYVLTCKLSACYVGQGVGPQTVPEAQVLSMVVGQPFSTYPQVPVPGGESPSQANFNTAITGTLTTYLEALIAANLAQIQGFATGGG